MVYLADTATLKIDQDLCTGCGVCLDVCPHEVFSLADGKAVIIDLDLCMECGACQRNCRYGAIAVRAGVGCAAALLSAMKSGDEASCGPSCGCGGDDDTGSCCG